MLKEGQKIKSKGNGYTLIIPRYNEPLIQEFYQKAKNYARDNKNEKRVGRFVDFVYKSIRGERGWEKGVKEVSLLSSLGLRKGVCKEKAAILSMILTIENFENYYKCGTVLNRNGRSRHAWVKVKVNDKFFLADPSFGPHFGEYEKVLKFNGYEEDEVFIKKICKELLKKVKIQAHI